MGVRLNTPIRMEVRIFFAVSYANFSNVCKKRASISYFNISCLGARTINTNINTAVSEEWEDAVHRVS